MCIRDRCIKNKTKARETPVAYVIKLKSKPSPNPILYSFFLLTWWTFKNAKTKLRTVNNGMVKSALENKDGWIKYVIP